MNTQNGSALILSLLLLLVMTMLGITAMSTSTLEEKMSANDRNQKVAFQNAELTLVQAENIARNLDYQKDIQGILNSDNPVGFYGENEQPDYFERDTWVPGTTCIDIANNQSGNQACYIIDVVSDEMLEQSGGYGGVPEKKSFILKVSALSTDSNGASRSAVQSTFQKIEYK